MCKIKLTDSTIDAISKMSEGNPGAIGAIMSIMADHERIDPQALMGGIGTILLLDTWGIYGADIYVLLNDKCDKDTRKMLLLMRAVQLGFFSHIKLKQLAADRSGEINLDSGEWSALDKKVCDELEQFERAA